MKRVVCLIGAVWFSTILFAQSLTLHIATNKTTSLVFPYAIKHVDRGTKDVLVQPVKEAENILLVKAAITDFAETNLSVITSDGSVYTFIVCYGNKNDSTYYLPGKSTMPVSLYASNMLDNPPTIRGIKDKRWKMVASLSGIYIRGDVMYYQILLKNESPIDYDVDFLKFFIRDKKRAKRTATQESELTALHISGNTKHVKANSQTLMVIALPKFTIPEGKILVMELGEKNGGRNLSMNINNRKILQAITLPDQK